MLQRGVELQTLDVSYVSSLSWYFLTLFGLGGLNSIFLGDTVIDDTQLMQEQMGMKGGMAAPPDINKVFQSEKENLELVKHEWELENVEQRLMGIGLEGKKEIPLEQKKIKDLRAAIVKRNQVAKKSK